MAIDERLRVLAAQVAAPPPGDPAATLRRGKRRRRSRRAGGLAGVAAVLGVVVVGASAWLTGPVTPQIADQPGWSDPPVIRTAPAATVSSSDPFPWAVAASFGDDDRWCVTTVHGSTEVPDVVGAPCHEAAPPDETGYSIDIVEHGVRASGSSDPRQRLAWGLAGRGTEEVVAEFTDGSRRRVDIAGLPADGAVLWAVGYEDVELLGVEAARSGAEAGAVLLHRRFPTIVVLAATLLVLLAPLAWMLRRRRRLRAGLPTSRGRRR